LHFKHSLLLLTPWGEALLSVTFEPVLEQYGHFINFIDIQDIVYIHLIYYHQLYLTKYMIA